jgi:AP-3 complex subunit beta
MKTSVLIVFVLQVLANIATFALQAPSLFASYFEEFFVRSCDADPIRALKLDILTTIATESSIHAILQEFQVDRLSYHGVC